MKNLTKREQILIGILILLILGSAFAFLIFLPTQQSIKANQTQLQLLKTQHAEMDQQMELYGTLDDDVAAAKEKAEEKLRYILPTQDNEETANDIVLLAKSRSLSLISVTVSDPTISAVDPLQKKTETAGDTPTDYPLREYLYQIYGETESVKENPIFDQILLNRNQVTLTFTASETDYLAFLDRIRDQYTSMRIVSASAVKQTETTEVAPATTTYVYNEDGSITQTENAAQTAETSRTVYTVVVDIYSTEGKQ